MVGLTGTGLYTGDIWLLILWGVGGGGFGTGGNTIFLLFTLSDTAWPENDIYSYGLWGEGLTDGFGGFINEFIDCCWDGGSGGGGGGGDCWTLSGLYTGGNDCNRLYIYI